VHSQSIWGLDYLVYCLLDGYVEMNKAVDKYKIWSSKPLNYNFKHVFILISVIYILSTMFDFCLTYIIFKLSPDGFFNNEISFIIKNAFGSEPVSYVLFICLFSLPLIVVYGLNIYLERRDGRHVNEMKICYYSIVCICVIHIWGGFTNFFHLINLRV